MPAFDVAAIRAQFPALRRQQDGRPVVFLDGPGGTQVPDRVIDAVAGYYRTMNANSGGSFVTSRASDSMAEAAHAAVAAFLGAGSPGEVKFGYNMTTLTFHVSRAIAATFDAGDEIVVTTLDHEANVSPWRAIAADRGLVVRTVDIHPEDGTLDLDSLEAALGDRTRLVAFGYASNALGTINPVAEIVRRAHAAGALTYVDAVHFAPHGSIDVRAIDTDFLVCSVYKWFGPHLGALYGKAAVLDRLPAYKVRPAHDRYETGTPSFEAYAGTLAAVDYLRELGRAYGDNVDDPEAGQARGELMAAMRAITAYERPLAGRMLAGLREHRGAARVGDHRPDPARRAHADVRGHARRGRAGRGGRGARPGRHLRLGRRLLRARRHRAPRPRRARRGPATWPGPLLNFGRGGSDAGGAGGPRRHWACPAGPARPVESRPQTQAKELRCTSTSSTRATTSSSPTSSSPARRRCPRMTSSSLSRGSAGRSRTTTKRTRSLRRSRSSSSATTPSSSSPTSGSRPPSTCRRIDDDNFLIASEDEFSVLGLSNADYRGAFADYIDEDGGSANN